MYKVWCSARIILGLAIMVYAAGVLFGFFPPKGLEGDAQTIHYILFGLLGAYLFAAGKASLEEMEEIENESFLSKGSH